MHGGRNFGEMPVATSKFNNNNDNLNQGTTNKPVNFPMNTNFNEVREFRPMQPLPDHRPYFNQRENEPNFNEYGQHKKKRQPKFMPMKKSELELFSHGVKQGTMFEELYGFERDEEIHVTSDCNESIQNMRIQDFEDCGLSRVMMQTITQILKYKHPTPIQRAVIPLIMKKRNDIIGYSQTGSGKTGAFLIPIIHELERIVGLNNQRNIKPAKNSPFCIILSPTRELTEQLFLEARRFALKTGVSVARSFGDMPMRDTLAEREKGCDIFVMTSGRLSHHLEAEHIYLDNLRYFVLDEADKLIEERHFLRSIDDCKMHKNYPSIVRLLMFSASFSHDVQYIANKYLRPGYIFIQIGKMNDTVESVKQEFIEVPKHRKNEYLCELLLKNAEEKFTIDKSRRYWRPTYKTLVFVSDKRLSDRTAIMLRYHNIRAMSINADRTLKQRIEAFEKFKNDLYDVLVASDLAARGLDIKGVDHVINYDLPIRENDNESYIHRIGRTGRAGNRGLATSFFDPDNPSDVAKAYIYIKYLQAKNSPVPDFLHKYLFENNDETREQFYMEGRINGERENAWGDQQQNATANNELKRGYDIGWQQKVNATDEEWLTTTRTKSNIEKQMDRQNNLNENFFASASAPKKPQNIFDFDEDDEDAFSKPNIAVYQPPPNIEQKNGYRHAGPIRSNLTEKNSQPTTSHQSDFYNYSSFPTPKERDGPSTRFPSPRRNRNKNRYGLNAELDKEAKFYSDCF